MFYGNELFGDIPNRFVYKNNNKLYDIWIRYYSKNILPPIIEKQVKNIMKKIYYKNEFPDIFTPEIGKLLLFEIAFKRRIFSPEVEYYYRLYPNDSIFAIADASYEVLFFLYEQLKNKGTILFHDYGFFSLENLHLIQNFLRKDNTNNEFVRNYYGEFTTDPSFDFTYNKLNKVVTKIEIKKTVEFVSKITNTPIELVNLDGEERKAGFFYDLIKERFQVWKITYEKFYPEIDIYVKELKNKNNLLEETIKKVNEKTNNSLTENNLLTIRKILLGYFNDDDHRFLTIRIEK